MKKRIQSFRYAFAGLADLFTRQPNAKIHALVGILVVLAGIYFSLSTPEWCLIALAIALVLMAEAFNTSLEYLTDLVSPNHHPLAGKAKDVAAAAVLCAAAGAAVVGLLIFIPKIARLLLL